MSTPQTTSEQQHGSTAPDDPITDPTVIHERFCEACNAGDLERLARLFEPGAVVVERNGERTEGIEAIREHLANLLSMRPAMTILDSRTAIAGEFALLSSHWRAAARAPDGSSVELDYHGAELARYQPASGWRLVIDNPWGAASSSP